MIFINGTNCSKKVIHNCPTDTLIWIYILILELTWDISASKSIELILKELLKLDLLEEK